MKITDEQLDRVNREPLTTCIEICKLVTSTTIVSNAGKHEPLILEVTLFLFAAGAAGLIQLPNNKPHLIDGKVSAVDGFNFTTSVQRQLEAIIEKDKILENQRHLEERFSRAINSSFGYELTEGDLKQVQSNIDKLRELIRDCADLSEDHKSRLLKRLEKVQSELHKKLSTLDQLYCLGIEASIVAHKIKAKPIFAIAKSLINISWRTHSHTEGLRSDDAISLLDAPDEQDTPAALS